MHQKHPKLARPTTDHYARTDVALVGSTCAVMDGLIDEWQSLNPEYRTRTIIGDHGEPVNGQLFQIGNKRFYTPNVDRGEYDERLEGLRYDLALVNGNHYPAARQIVFVDPAKAGTLERRREQLTDVLAVILCPGAEGMPDWLTEDLGRQPVQPPVCRLEQATENVLPLLKNLLGSRVPALKSLVLIGGQSRRMGARKADLVYRNGQTEAERMVAICERITPGRVHLSVADSEQNGVGDYPRIEDRFLGLGPAGAISSAMLHDPDAAWLVVACDLPLLDRATVADLVAARRPNLYATAYRRPGERFPEPLVAIYEPRAYQRFLQYLSMGYACPRKVLINSDAHVLDAADDAPFTNANTPEERAAVLDILATQR